MQLCSKQSKKKKKSQITEHLNVYVLTITDWSQLWKKCLIWNKN